MPLRFVRFVLGRRDQDSGIEEGLLRLAYVLRDSSLLLPTDRESLAETLMWFEKNLDTPVHFNRTRSKGFFRRKARGIAWFKDTATEHVAAAEDSSGWLVDQTRESWNRMKGWLVRLECLRTVA